MPFKLFSAKSLCWAVCLAFSLFCLFLFLILTLTRILICTGKTFLVSLADLVLVKKVGEFANIRNAWEKLGPCVTPVYLVYIGRSAGFKLFNHKSVIKYVAPYDKLFK